MLQEYLKSEETPLAIKGGLLGRRILSAAEVEALAKLPPKEELVGKFVGLLQSPIARLMRVLTANLQGLLVVLEARRKQLEEGG